MQTAYSPASAAEFPNDNPGLHRGARWVCRQTLGAARALLRAERPSEASGSAARDHAVVAPEGDGLAARLPSPGAAQEGSPPSDEPTLRCLQLAGPLELDLGRIVLPHRVENVPPPPEFIFRLFESSRARQRTLALETLAAQPPLELLRYRIVDQREASRRVQRSWRVDIAPCLNIEAPPSERPVPLARLLAEAAPSARLLAQVACPQPALPEAASVEPAPAEPARKEPARRQRRRVGAPAARAPSPSPLPDSGELERAILDLETAFAERAPDARREDRRRAPRGPAGCTSLSSAVLSALSAGGV